MREEDCHGGYAGRAVDDCAALTLNIVTIAPDGGGQCADILSARSCEGLRPVLCVGNVVGAYIVFAMVPPPQLCQNCVVRMVSCSPNIRDNTQQAGVR
jgi:hypothetical protein